MPIGRDGPVGVSLAGLLLLVVSVGVMAMFHRRRPLGLRPTAEWHEEFVREHPDADQLLAEADDYLARREAEYELGIAPQAADDAELID